MIMYHHSLFMSLSRDSKGEGGSQGGLGVGSARAQGGLGVGVVALVIAFTPLSNAIAKVTDFIIYEI